MFHILLDEAARHACAAREIVRRLDNMAAREYACDDERPAEEILRLAATFARQESLSAASLAAAATALGQADAYLSKNLTSGIDPGRASRTLAAVTAALEGINTAIPRVGEETGAIFGKHTAVTIGQALQAASGETERARAAANRNLLAAFDTRPPGSPVIESTARTIPEIYDHSDSLSVNAHLLILMTQESSPESFYFNLSTASYDSLRRQSSYNIASQNRLTRRPALQAVAKGGDTITVSGAVFTKQSGASRMNRLRGIAFKMLPLILITGYGESFGLYYLTRIDEEQSGLFPDGMPRKQTFTLEFQRYGEDYQNV